MGIQEHTKDLVAADDLSSREDKFIIPPGLSKKVEEFVAHYEVAPQEPIMIVGDTGVGKSLFLHLFKALYRKEHQEIYRKDDPKKLVYPIEEANCAHFGGSNSDPNVARIELFGSNKGRASCVEDTVGLVEKADNGLLILEEIGELPLEVQAMLLTFIETGKYRKFGGEETRKAKVQIIGATNREEELRSDFRFRFFPFYIPPLYKRRLDVLYYLQNNFPEIIETLAPWEVTTLLAHNWPGNVREVQRVGWLLRRGQKMDSATTKAFPSIKMDVYYGRKKFLSLDQEATSLNPSYVLDLYSFLKANNVNVELLETLLNKSGVGLSLDNTRKAFKDFSKDELLYKDNEILKIPEIDCLPFEDAFLGLHMLCSITYQNYFADKNLLDIWSGPSKISKTPGVMINSGLAKSCFTALSGITLNKGDRLPDSREEKEKLFAMLGKNYPDNEFLDSLGFTPHLKKKDKTEDLKIEEITRDQMLKIYYEKLLRTTGGNIAKAARIAGEPRSTLWGDLNRLGVFQIIQEKYPRHVPQK